MLLAASLLFSALVQPAAQDDIVIEGVPLVEEDLRGDIRAITDVEDGQIARFPFSVCPLVLGLNEEFDFIVEGQLRELAVDADISLGDPGCDANLFLIFSDDPVVTIDALRRVKRFLFQSLDPGDLRRLRSGEGPVYSWRLTQVGGNISRLNNGANSRIRTEVQLDIVASFVIVDRSAIEGASLRQLAHYGALMGLAPVRSGQSETLDHPSILTLFEDRDAERAPLRSASEVDRAYLRALYSGSNARSARAKARQMTQMIRRELAEDN